MTEVASWGGLTPRRAALSLSLLALAASARGGSPSLASGGLLGFAAPVHHAPAHRRSVACSGSVMGHREETFAAEIAEELKPDLLGLRPRTKHSIQVLVSDSREAGGLTRKDFLRKFQEMNAARVARGEEDIGEPCDPLAGVQDSLVAQVVPPLFKVCHTCLVRREHLLSSQGGRCENRWY